MHIQTMGTDAVRLTAKEFVISVERTPEGKVFIWVIETHGTFRVELGKPGYEVIGVNKEDLNKKPSLPAEGVW